MSKSECRIQCLHSCPFVVTEEGKNFCALEDKIKQEEHQEDNNMQEVFEKIIERLGRCCEMQKDMIGRESRYSMNDETYEHGARVYENAIKIVQQAATEHNNGWILCNERSPEDSEEVLATDGKYVYLVKYDADLDASFGDMDGIVAWQPLPAPYQPKGE